MADLIITKEVLEDSTTKLQHISDELEHQEVRRPRARPGLRPARRVQGH
ncbi:hypothetical protein QP157_20925 [Sphingomonas sp. LR61]